MDPNNPANPQQQQPGTPNQQPGQYGPPQGPPQGQLDPYAQASQDARQYGQPTQGPGGSPSGAPGSINAPAFTGPNGALVQQPEIYNSPSLANVPYGAQPTPQPVTGNPGLRKPLKKGPNKLVLAVIGGVVLLLIITVVVIIAASQKPKPKPTQQAADNTQSQSLQPAQAIDLEQASNAISQDLSSLDDEKDFPAASLEDKTLGL